MRHFSRLLFFMACVSATISALAQDIEQDKDQSKQYFDLANEMLISTRAVDDARELMVMAANYDTTNLDANYEAGHMFIITINKPNATKFFLRIYRQKPDYKFDIEYRIGQGYQYGMDFEKAIEYYNLYKNKLSKSNYRGKDKIPSSEVERRIEECFNGIKLKANPKPVTITNLGSQVNSEYDDYAPVISSDESELIFTTRRRDGNINEDVWDDNKPYEDIFVSKKVEGNWQQAKNIGTSINTKFNNSNLALSPQGNTLFIYKDGVGEGDIFYSERAGSGNWSEAKPLLGGINSPYQETSITINKDENIVYFASFRPGGLGGSDIYSATKNSKGQWADVKNLGPGINTPYDEEAPYIDYDGKTLYFSSKGRNGMGGHDIYKAILLNANRNEWSEPENLGFPVNTPDNDIFISGTATPNRFYYASERSDGLGYSDIYLITDGAPKEEPKVEPTQPIVTEPVKQPAKEGPQTAPATSHKFIVNVVDADNKKPIDAEVRLQSPNNVEVPGLKQGTGMVEYQIKANAKQTYLLYVEKQGYIFENFKVLIAGASEKKDETKTVMLRKVRAGAVTALRRVFFDPGMAVLKPESSDELNKLVDMLKQNPTAKVEIAGHTDNVGSATSNQQLSQKRAVAVKEYLNKNGIDAKRVTAVGYGETRPLVSNDDELGGREINRRVEFKIL